VVVVSEEDGTISLAKGGVLTRHLDPAGLRQRLEAL
jgi:DNA integrity scanning protein DisA with diadenylate cyclase activity